MNIRGNVSSAIYIWLILASCSSSQRSIEWKTDRLNEHEEYYAAYERFGSSNGLGVDNISHRLFTETLRQFDEPSFCSDGLEFDAYRFLLYEAFSGTTMFRVEKRKNRAFLYWKETKSFVPGELSEVSQETKTKISLSDWNKIAGIR